MTGGRHLYGSFVYVLFWAPCQRTPKRWRTHGLGNDTWVRSPDQSILGFLGFPGLLQSCNNSNCSLFTRSIRGKCRGWLAACLRFVSIRNAEIHFRSEVRQGPAPVDGNRRTADLQKLAHSERSNRDWRSPCPQNTYIAWLHTKISLLEFSTLV